MFLVLVILNCMFFVKYIDRHWKINYKVIRIQHTERLQLPENLKQRK